MTLGDKLPSGWADTTLAEICTSIGGGTPPTTDPSYWDNGSIPWVSPKDMKVFRIVGSIDAVTNRALEKLTLVPRGSVLVVVRSGILAHSLPVALNEVPVVLNQDMRAFVPKGEVLPAFIAWQLVARGADVIDSCTKDGTTVASIESARLASFQLRLAPAAEQIRIVGAIESLLSQLDDAARDLREAQYKVAAYRQSLLKLAFEGALTSEWRTANEHNETASDLLKQALRRKSVRLNNKRRSSSDYVRAEQLAEQASLPKAWVWACIGDLICESGYGSSAKCEESGAGTPVLRIPNVREGSIDLSEMKFSLEPLPMAPAEHIKVGDVLVIRTNGSVSLVGRAAAVARPGLGSPHYFASYLLRLRPAFPRQLGAWVAIWLSAPAARTLIERLAASSAGQHNVSLSNLLALPIPVPPIPEVREVLERLADGSRNIGKLRDELDRAQMLVNAQRQNILRAAFSGQLVPQDPNDEPASVVLERIRSQRMACPPAKATRRAPGRGRKLAA